MLETYIVPLHLKEKAKQFGYNEIDRVRELRWWKWLTIISWIITAIVICLWLFIPDLEAKETTPLSIAQSQIGLGEIGSNNKGVYVRKYLNGKEGLPWCAGFISYCLKKAQIKAPYTLRARDFMKLGRLVKNPQAGDLIIFSRQGGGHVEIIEKITKDTIITIAGNLGAYPSVVKRVAYRKNNIKNLLAFVRIK